MKIISSLIFLLSLSGCARGTVPVAVTPAADDNSAAFHKTILLTRPETERAWAGSTMTPDSSRVYGAISPHHTLAVSVMADLFKSLSTQKYSTVVIVGPDHYGAGTSAVTISDETFDTPYGVLKPAPGIAAALADMDDVQIDEYPFEREHAILALAGFVKKNWPDAEFLPVLLNLDIDPELAEQAGYKFAKFLPPNSLVIASCDFAHHMDAASARNFDRQSVEVLRDFDVEAVNGIEVDSRGSIIALMSYLKQFAAEDFVLVRNTNAAEILDAPDYDDVTSYIAGYYTCR